MADLATLGSRRDTQRKLTSNRSSILPDRRDTRTPELVVRSDMRTAALGDGGAEDLKRVLGDFMRSAGGAYSAQIANSRERYQVEAAEGMAAAVSGQALPEDAPTPYEEAYHRVQAEGRFNAFSARMKEEVAAAVDEGAAPDEINNLITGGFGGFIKGFSDDIPSTSARIATVDRIRTLASELETTTAARITERTRDALVGTQDANIATFLRARPPVTGDPLQDGIVSVPVEAWIRTYRDGGLSPAEAKAKTITAIRAVALDRDSPRPDLLEALLDSTQDDGKTPSLNALEQGLVQDHLTQARNLLDQRERQLREDRRDALMGSWTTRALDGEIVDDDIIQAGRDGVLEPQEIIQYRTLAENLRDAPQEGHEDTDFVLDLTRRAALGNPPSNAEVLRWASTGRFGTGRAAQRAAIRFLQDATPRSSGGNGSSGGSSGLSARAEATRNVSTARRFLLDETQPDSPRGDWSSYQREMLVMQDREFNRRVRAGEDAFAVSQDLAKRNRDVIARDRRPTAPRLPNGNQTVAPGSYTWSPS